jgi:hypothetical protein
MKKTLIIILVLFGIQIEAQETINTKIVGNSGFLNFGEQSFGIATGIDYSIAPIQLNYKRAFELFNYKHPIILGMDVAVPLFEFDLNDIKIKLTTETTLYRKSNFEIRGGIDPLFVNVKMDTESMSSLGADFHSFTGFVKTKWTTGLEFNYNQIFSTYIKHYDKYLDNVFIDAKDGWYKNTAANIKIGFLVNRRFNKYDVYLKAGYATTGQFNSYLFVPSIYANIGVNYRF